MARQWALVLNADKAKLTDDVRKERNALEREVRDLRAKKDTTPAEEYDAKLEKLMVQIAKLSTTAP